MLGEFDFHMLQIQHIKAAMDQLPTFTPLAMTPTQMQWEYDSGVTARTDYQNKYAAVNLARGVMREKTEAAHQVAIGVYGVMKSRYRKDPGAIAAINRLPTQDRTQAETRVRMEAISSLWGQLPNDPLAAPPGSLIAWPFMTKAAFDAIANTMNTAQTAFVAAFEDFQMSEGELHAKDDHLADMAVSALAEGRAQFAIGTPQREVIDSIPTNGTQPEPNQAVISVATSPGVGEAHLEFDALHATSFDVLHKGPVDLEFAIVADDTVENFYDATGLEPGQHEYQVIGENSRGVGPPSDIATIEIGVV